MAVSLLRDFFEKKLWPDFSEKDYNKILKKFKNIKEIFEIFNEKRTWKRIFSSLILIPISFFIIKGSFFFIFFWLFPRRNIMNGIGWVKKNYPFRFFLILSLYGIFLEDSLFSFYLLLLFVYQQIWVDIF